jgi:hypothetical protein
VSWAHFPQFILNKATALAAVGFVGCSYLVGRVIERHNHDPVIRLLVVARHRPRGLGKATES